MRVGMTSIMQFNADAGPKRLRIQHRILSLALGGPCPDNYAQIIRRRLEVRNTETIRICDLGCGPGDWYGYLS